MVNVNRFVEKMDKWTFCLAVNLLLIIGIFLCALLGRSLGIQGPALAISVVWPATGLSLSALLIFGYRAGVGVFAGNFAYNFLFLILYTTDVHITILDKVIVGTFISLGSFVQALVSAYIIRIYCSPLVFRTVQDVFIFLFPASVLSCLISSSVGVAALAIGGGLAKGLILPVWLTFWLGDTVGIYVVTPLIIIWTLHQKEVKFLDHALSLACMAFLFAGFSFATYFFSYPLPHLFVPISIWAAYLFRMHGASLAILLMTASSITFAAFHGYEGTSLISLITFIGVTIAASLIIAAVVNERTQAWALLDSRNLYLEREVSVKVEILEQVRSEVIQKRKFSTQDVMSQSMVQQLHAHLRQIERISKSSQESLEEIQKLLSEEKNFNTEKKKIFDRCFLQINQGLSETVHLRNLIAEIFENTR